MFGQVHVVCNNAGINMFAPMDECTYDDWDWIMGVNLGGVINGVQTFIPRLKAHGEGGHIVNTASMAAFITGPGAGIYTATKFAVRGLTESLRWNLAPLNIGVSVLCPGLVNSAIHESDKVRPEALSKNVGPVDQAFMERLADIHKVGMDPRGSGRESARRDPAQRPLHLPASGVQGRAARDLRRDSRGASRRAVDPKRLAFEEFRRANKRNPASKH